MSSPFKLLGFDHVRFNVGNARQASHYYQSVFGFNLVGYRGLEQGDREKASYVLRQNDVVFIVESPYRGESPMNEWLGKHGDGVCDIAFAVDDTTRAWEYTTSHGAKSAFEPRTLEDESGKVIIAGIHTYGDVTHTFVQRKITEPGRMPSSISRVISSGAFLPGIWAVQMTTSAAARWRLTISRWRRRNSSPISLA